MNSNSRLLILGADSEDIQTGEKSTWSLMKRLFSEEAFQYVTYQGKIPYALIDSYIQIADVCIFPSYAEALPVSWLEALAAGKPVVASNIGWAKEIIDEGVDGFLVHPSDHEKYANRIQDFLLNPALREFVGNNAKNKIANKFSNEKVANRNIQFYHEVIESYK